VLPDHKLIKNKQSITVNTLKVDDLFGKPPQYKVVDLFADDFNLTEATTTSNSSKRNSSNSEHEMLLPLDTCVTKKWIVITPDNDKYGTYSCKEIYHFLKYFFDSNPELRDQRTFMVADIDNDIYYLPDSIMDILAEQVKEDKPMEDKKDLERIILNKIKKKNYIGRRLMEYPRLISKYDIVEMNQHFKTPIINIPFKGLKDQLKSIGQKRNMTYFDKPLDVKPYVNNSKSCAKEIIKIMDVNDLFI
jgi:hypothetical protein